MNIRWLRVFETVAQSESMSIAAEQLYISQPAVSQSIADLEHHIGTQLFDRIGGGIQLNSVGQLFLERTTQILSQLDHLQEDVQTLERHSTLHIGSTITSATFLLPGLLKQLEDNYPNIRAQVTVKNAAQLEELLIKGEMDIGFLEGVVSSDVLHKKTLPSFKLTFFCATNHPLAHQESIPIDRLLDEPMLLREKGSAIRETLDSALLLKGITLSPLWNSVNSGVLLEAVSQGLGVSILPNKLLDVAINNSRVAPFTVDNLQLSCPSQVAYHKHKQLTSPLRQLIE